jgi:rare lipoprotein A (peptidoglycan hydrolase)
MKGVASFYGLDPVKEHLNKYTASGDEFLPSEMTCALPVSVAKKMGIYREWCNIKVKYQDKEIIVTYNDTGPAERLNRICDLTVGAFSKLAPLSVGLIDVEIEKI